MTCSQGLMSSTGDRILAGTTTHLVRIRDRQRQTRAWSRCLGARLQLHVPLTEYGGRDGHCLECCERLSAVIERETSLIPNSRRARRTDPRHARYPALKACITYGENLLSFPSPSRKLRTESDRVASQPRSCPTESV